MSCWRQLIRFLIILGLVALSGCSASNVSQIRSGECLDLTGTFTGCDYRKTSQAIKRIATQQLSWWNKFKKSPHWEAYQGLGVKHPIIVIGKIQNQTKEIINTDELTQDLKKEMINRGRGIFVIPANNDELLTWLEKCEKTSQKLNCPAPKKATPPHFILRGRITFAQQLSSNKQIRRYKTILELVHIESREIFWTDYYEIEKLITFDQGVL